MEQKKHKRSSSILKQSKKDEVVLVKFEARLLEYMQNHPELAPDAVIPPPDEFQKIMDGLNKRGKKLVVRRQLILRYQARRLIRFLHNPLLITMLAMVLLMESNKVMTVKKPSDFNQIQRTIVRNMIYKGLAKEKFEKQKK